MHTVHVRVNDAAAGKPTPVRIRFLDERGVYHAPLGRLTEFATESDTDVGGNVRLGLERFAYLDGTCEIRLPAGNLIVEATKGPEYSPLRRPVTLAPGQISLRFNVERWIDLRSEGWFAGDFRARALTPHAALLEGAAEGLAVVNLLAEERPPRPERPAALPNLLAFSGTAPALASPECLVVVNTLNAHPHLGTVALLNSHRVVYPLRSGAPGPDDWSVADWCDQCHRKRGLVVWPDLPRLTAEHPQGEALACLILGKIDALEISRFADPEPETLADWYRLLSCGFRVPLVGASGKADNATALGGVRTYARVEPGTAFDYAAWIDAVRAGRTFATNGPLLTLTADGRLPGSVIFVSEPGKPIRVRAELRSALPIDQLELLYNGSLLAVKEASGDRRAAVIETEYSAAASGWLAARCWGRERVAGGAGGQCVYAHTSPIYVEVGGEPLRPEAESVAPLLAVLDRTSVWVARDARCESERQRERLQAVVEAARQALRRGPDEGAKR